MCKDLGLSPTPHLDRESFMSDEDIFLSPFLSTLLFEFQSVLSNKQKTEKISCKEPWIPSVGREPSDNPGSKKINKKNKLKIK